jgi:chaperonin GroES
VSFTQSRKTSKIQGSFWVFRDDVKWTHQILTKEHHNMADQNLRPLADRVIVEPLDRDETTASGLLLPETAKEKPQEGKILAVGPGRWDEDGKKRLPLEVAIDDKVIFAKYSGTEIKLGDKKLLILSEKDILAVVQN